MVDQMPDLVEPSVIQRENDRNVVDLFKKQPRMGKVIQLRPTVAPVAPTAAPVAPTAAPRGTSPTPRAAPASAHPRAKTPAHREAIRATRAAHEASAQARRAVHAEAAAFADVEPTVPVRSVPPAAIYKRANPFVLLGVAAAALFGAVAF